MTELCWKPDRVKEIVNIDADYVPDTVFRAVDHDVSLTFRGAEGETESKVTTDELIERFLSPFRNHYQLAILGPAGTGKSHLVHRMRQRIQGRPGIEILAVSRLETNLHAILEKLIARLPLGQQEHYRAELDKVEPELSTPEFQMGRLLDSLSQAIEEDVRSSESKIDPELEKELLFRLPDMFRDPYLRKAKFLGLGEIVPDLVDRLFSSREGKRLEERVLFKRANLPLDSINLQNCSMQARDAINIFLYDSERIIPPTLSVINRCLERAIARTLNFSGDQLGKLLGEIRAHLKIQGQELIILFEEFARLQGYDSAMLEALLVQGNNKLCNIRWALACTTGRFREFPDTVRTRMDGLVDMETLHLKDSIKDFAGRYLNAVRNGCDGLDRAFASSGESEIPNACEQCPKHDDCTTAFGITEEGYSLYPFTEVALNTMAKAVNPEFETKFNPRLFQKHVLWPVLVDEAVALKNNEFPTKSLTSCMGSPDTDFINILREKAGTNFERYLALFRIWSGDRLKNPPEGVIRAFGLQPLLGLDSIVDIEVESISGPTQPTPPPLRSDPDWVKLDDWADGGELDQTLAHRIRLALFPLIDRSIDWDAIGLLPSTFSASTANRPFRNSSIAFVRQATTGGSRPLVRLELPLGKSDTDFELTASAFRTLLKIEKTGKWEAGGELNRFVALLELVDACAVDAVMQLRDLRGRHRNWDPITGIVELLLVGSALGGAMTATQSQTDEGLVEALFKSIPQECHQTTAELKKLYELLYAKHKELKELLSAHASASKGGQKGNFIDPVALLTAARLFRRRNWQLNLSPEVLPNPYKFVGELYAKLREQLPSALLKEQSERICWVREVEAKLGLYTDKQSVLKAVCLTLDAAATGGLPGKRTALETARDEFATVQFAAAVEAAKRISDADPPEKELPHFARTQWNAVKATRGLIERWSDFLASAETEVKAQRADDASEKIRQDTQRLKDALSGLIDELSDLRTS